MPALPEITRIELPTGVVGGFPEVFTSPSSGNLYRNPWPHPELPPGAKGLLRWKGSRNRLRPKGYVTRALDVPESALADFDALRAPSRLFWIGHASFLLELDGIRLAIDPIFGRAGGVVPRVTKAAAQARELTGLHAVLITHGHHDHLDARSIDALARANGSRPLFVVPRGLARVLPASCTRVVELDWWQSVEIDGVRIVFVPAQHWHRRGVFDTNSGLWGGYVVEGTHRIYHSGDTGFFRGFEAIGEVFGGIDAACLPLGAYEPTWFMAAQHMDPEGSLAAYEALGATHFVGMHWGAYDLSDEPLDAGPRFIEAKLAAGAISPERTHVIGPGGSLGLEGAPNATQATRVHDFLAVKS